MYIDELIGKKIAVHCDTAEKAEAFLAECRKACVKWSGITKMSDIKWNKYYGETCYSLSMGRTSMTYGSLTYFVNNDYTIVEYVADGTVEQRQKQTSSVYAGMTAKFTPDTHIYSVYISTADVKLDKISAMTLVDNSGQKCYRLEAPYFTDPLCSTCLLDWRHLNTALKLKCGTVYYFTSKTQALQTAKEAKAQKITEKVAATAKLQEEVKHLRSIKIAFD